MLGRLFSRKSATLRNVILVDHIVSPETESWDVVEAVVSFVNKMRSEALVHDAEMPQNAIQLYNADYYYAQVSNGGHSQFIHNTRRPEQTLINAAKTFQSIGLDELGLLAVKAANWVRANPQEAESQDGFETRAAALEPLDKELFADGSYSEAASNWIRSWKNLKLVSALDYPNAIEQCAALNPKYELRKKAAKIDRLNSLVRDRLRTGLQLAACDEDINQVVLQIHGGTPFKVEYEDTYLWGVTTSLGHRGGIVCSAGAVIVTMQDGNIRERVGGRGLPYLDAAIAHATRHEIGGAISMLTQKAEIDGDVQFVICATLSDASDTKSDAANYLAKIGEQIFVITVTNSAASIARLNTNKALAKLSMRAVAKTISRLSDQLAYSN